jgi:hypothetical protein
MPDQALDELADILVPPLRVGYRSALDRTVYAFSGPDGTP